MSGATSSGCFNRRCAIGAFPWRYEGLEARPCRIVCFFGVDDDIEAVDDEARAIDTP